MSRIKITYLRSWRECECCGSYEDVDVVVTKDYNIIYEGWKGGHFGDGIDVEEPKVILPKILEALGHEVIMEDYYAEQ